MIFYFVCALLRFSIVFYEFSFFLFFSVNLLARLWEKFLDGKIGSSMCKQPTFGEILMSNNGYQFH